MREVLAVALLTVGASVLVGCGEEEWAHAVDEQPPEVVYAGIVRDEVARLRETERGELPDATALVEGMEGFENEAVGEHKETYRQIYENAKELQAMIDRNAPKAEINEKIGEIESLAEKLPKGTATPPDATKQ